MGERFLEIISRGKHTDEHNVNTGLLEHEGNVAGTKTWGQTVTLQVDAHNCSAENGTWDLSALHSECRGGEIGEKQTRVQMKFPSDNFPLPPSFWSKHSARAELAPKRLGWGLRESLKRGRQRRNRWMVLSPPCFCTPSSSKPHLGRTGICVLYQRLCVVIVFSAQFFAHVPAMYPLLIARVVLLVLFSVWPRFRILKLSGNTSGLRNSPVKW